MLVNNTLTLILMWINLWISIAKNFWTNKKTVNSLTLAHETRQKTQLLVPSQTLLPFAICSRPPKLVKKLIFGNYSLIITHFCPFLTI